MTSSHFPWSFRAAQSSFGVHWGQGKASEVSSSVLHCLQPGSYSASPPRCASAGRGIPGVKEVPLGSKLPASSQCRAWAAGWGAWSCTRGMGTSLEPVWTDGGIDRPHTHQGTSYRKLGSMPSWPAVSGFAP